MRVEAVLFVVSNVAVWSHSPLDDAHDSLLRRFRKPRYGWDVRLAIRAPGAAYLDKARLDGEEGRFSARLLASVKMHFAAPKGFLDSRKYELR